MSESGPDRTKYPKPNFKSTEKNEENVRSFMAHSMDYVQQLQRPRIIKTHLGLELLPKDLLKTCKLNILLKFIFKPFFIKVKSIREQQISKFAFIFMHEKITKSKQQQQKKTTLNSNISF